MTKECSNKKDGTDGWIGARLFKFQILPEKIWACTI